MFFFPFLFCFSVPLNLPWKNLPACNKAKESFVLTGIHQGGHSQAHLAFSCIFEGRSPFFISREMASAAMIRVLLLFFLVYVTYSILPVTSESEEGYTITGRIKVEGAGTKGLGLPSKLSSAKVLLNAGQKVSFVRSDGYFLFHNVSAGTHLIEVAAMGYFFSPVRVDISARNNGRVQAALTENRRALTELVLEPLREEYYYEIRQPFSIMSLVKSPMGLMVGFMLIVVFLMPKLMENLDPEEIKRAQEEMRSQGVPSISSLLTRN